VSEPDQRKPDTILPAEVDHAATLARLHAELFVLAWDTESFKQFLTHPRCAALLACASRTGEIIGFVVAQSAADEMEILSLGVAKDSQRQGIGCRLLDALMRLARQREVHRLYLEVAAGNSAARGFYHRLGFEECGRRKGYYVRAGALAEDAILLSLTL
jgi:ribosomal-protein-alanine N-acetyltransferase